ncbi:response regulator transcription factor [Rhizobium brockwellii]|jgi:two-component system OmpR family response regulator|uniref:response regulator transcription factor n=1 Tax=Rhizobium brockwellii TaxID=3019932 RepID=UPI003F951774
MRILLVEDDISQGTAIRDLLKDMGFAVDWVTTRVGADEMLRMESYECLLLDLTLPDHNGEDILRSLRMRSDLSPVLILSGRTNPRERARLLDAGADDFVSKPYDKSELVARIKNVTRRLSVSPLPEIRVGALVVQRAERLVERDGERISLSPREWGVLECLLNRLGQIVERRTIESTLYDFAAEFESNTVEVYVSRLRRKIGADLIETVRGYGYRLVDN